MNTLILRLDSVQLFLDQAQEIRHQLMDELLDNATDPVIRQRRLAMLKDLASYESSTLEKLARFDSDRIADWQSISRAINGLIEITNRSA